MNQEDKQFLAELARELNTQDNAGTANPIWCIMDKEIEFVPEDNGDFFVVVSSDGAIPLEDFVDEMLEQVPDALKQEAEEALCMCTNTDELKEALEAFTSENPDDYQMYEACKEERICRDATGFLTKKVCGGTSKAKCSPLHQRCEGLCSVCLEKSSLREADKHY